MDSGTEWLFKLMTYINERAPKKSVSSVAENVADDRCYNRWGNPTKTGASMFEKLRSK